MGSLRASRPSARATGTLALGALALHELRYLLGSGAGLDAHASHAYMAQAVPVVVALGTALLAAALLAPLGGSPHRAGRRSVPQRAVLYAGLLLVVFAAQELTEAWISGAGLDAIASLVVSSGWIAVPLALALGGVAAAATRTLEVVELRLEMANGSTPRTRRRREGSPKLAGTSVRPLATDVLAFGLARRPPPAALLT